MAYKDSKTHKSKMSTVRDTKLCKLYIGFNGECFRCSRSFPNYQYDTWQVEHVIPQIWYVRNGLKINHNFDNLALLCSDCNRKMADLMQKDYMVSAKDKKRLEACQNACINASDQEIKNVAMAFCKQSRKFCKGYQSGMHLEKFWKK